MIQSTEPIMSLLWTISLSIALVLFLIFFVCRARAMQVPSVVGGPASEKASQLLERIRAQRKEAKASIEAGELRKAQRELSEILEDLSRGMGKLLPLGPKNSTEIRDEVAFTLDATTAEILLEDLRHNVDSLDGIKNEDINVLESEFTEDRLDCISNECDEIADELEDITARRGLQRIKDEAQLLREEVRSRVDATRKQFSLRRKAN
ncbi:MAG: hypothetical protein ACW98Y_18060 [Candidatus Thorarchaeota archaeon]